MKEAVDTSSFVAMPGGRGRWGGHRGLCETARTRPLSEQWSLSDGGLRSRRAVTEATDCICPARSRV